MSFLERQQSARLRSRIYTLQFALLSIPCVLAAFVATMCSVWIIFTLLLAKLLSVFDERLVDAVLGTWAYVLASGIGLTIAVLWYLSSKRRGQLGRAGEFVADELKAMPVTRATPDVGIRRLHNIAEEMALAAGIPAPSIYVWPEALIINALTVGHSSSDAAIFVTRGAAESLTRDELQALVGHGISQVLNGDMALNSRLAIYLYAYNFGPRVAKWWLLFPFREKGSEFVKSLMLWLVFALWIGLALGVVTFPGYLGARLLQIGIGRERQKLADASAVQFTRNAPALQSTLMKALAMGTASLLASPALRDLAHGCFASPGRHKAFNTHRPLQVRIRTLDPRMTDAAIEVALVEVRRDLERRRAQAGERRRQEIARELEARKRKTFVERVVAASTAASAAAILPKAPAREAGPLGELVASGDVRAVLLALLIERQPEVQKLQLDIVANTFGAQARAALAQSLRALRPLAPRERTLALDTHLPSLRQLPSEELRRLGQAIVQFEAVDDSTDVFEYVVARRATAFIRDLLQPRVPHGNARLSERAVAAGTVLSILAQHGGRRDVAAGAFAAGMGTLALANAPRFVPATQWVRPLDRALAALDSLQPIEKQKLIEAMTVTIRFDRVETLAETELVRTIGLSLHCPLPRGPNVATIPADTRAEAQ